METRKKSKKTKTKMTAEINELKANASKLLRSGVSIGGKVMNALKKK